MAIWTLSHTLDADLDRIAAALRRIDPTFRLHEARGWRTDFRHGIVPVRQAEGAATLQETIWDARFDDAWRGPKIAPLLDGLIDVIPGAIGESEDEVEKVYNPMAALPATVRSAIEKVLPHADRAYQEALRKARDMFATHGKAGTVVINPFAHDPAERYRVMTEEEAAEAAKAMRADEHAAMARADAVQSRDGRLPRPWEAAWSVAVAPLTPVQAAIFQHLVATQIEAQEFVMDVRAYDASTTLIAVAPAADPTWRGDIGSLVDALEMGLRIGPQTVLVHAPVEQVQQDLARHAIPIVSLSDLLDVAATALANTPQT